MANLGGLGLRGATVVLRALARSAASFDFALQLGDSIFIPALAVRGRKRAVGGRVGAGGANTIRAGQAQIAGEQGTYFAFIWLCCCSSE